MIKEGWVNELIPETFNFLNLRDYQKEAIEFILEGLKSKGGAILESPTGSGKTIMSLVSAISYARENKKRILYLTRTNSQQNQVIEEIRKLRESTEIKAVAIQGRGNLCPLYKEIENEEDFSAESLSKMCSSRKKKVVEGHHDACRFYNNQVRSDDVKNLIIRDLISPELVYEELIPRDICPYESIKFAMRDADICIMPYSYFLNPNIAPSVLYNLRTSRENIVIIMDEAHNLPDLSRGIFSFHITMHQIELVEKECADYGDPEFIPRIRATDICEFIRNAILDMEKERLSDINESRVMFMDFIEYITINAKINREKLEFILEGLDSLGDSIEEAKEKLGYVVFFINLRTYFPSISLRVIDSIRVLISLLLIISNFTDSASSIIFSYALSLAAWDISFESLAPDFIILSMSPQTIEITIGPKTGPLPASSMPQRCLTFSGRFAMNT